MEILTARDGYYYTNGETYGTIIELGTYDKKENWQEVTYEQMENLLKVKEEFALLGM